MPIAIDGCPQELHDADAVGIAIGAGMAIAVIGIEKGTVSVMCCTVCTGTN